ncbi:MAG: FtsH protease activity modulator HflK [Rickettsiales bacterium]|nr:FtsH protease activity modulator HflK [Rickettsiales bacterium]
MNWTNKGPGNQGPWGPRSGGGNQGGGNGPRRPGKQTPPDFNEFLQRSQDTLKGMLGGGGGQRSFMLIAMVVGLLWVGLGIYRVEADELGVVLRFGQFNRTTEAGLHYHLPYPIETVLKPSVSRINTVEVGGSASQMGQQIYSRNALSDAALSPLQESQMLTGDSNIVEVNFEVQWRINAAEPEKFLFNVRDAYATVKPVAESAMREVIGQMKLEAILTTEQGNIATRTQDIIQRVLNNYDAGIEVVSVNLSKPDVPNEVIDAFQDVKKAQQDRETTVNIADRYRNEIIPKANGDASRMEQEALAYKKQVVDKAEGETSRFLAVYEQFRLAEDVTRKRIYLETMEEILHGMQKVVVDQKTTGGSGVVPYLPLSTLAPSRSKELN